MCPGPLAWVSPFGWGGILDCAVLKPRQAWSDSLYTAIGRFDDAKAVVERIDAALQADPKFQAERAAQIAEWEREQTRIMAELDQRSEEVDKAKRTILGFDEESREEMANRVAAAERRYSDAWNRLQHAELTLEQLRATPGLTGKQKEDLKDFLENPREWSKSNGVYEYGGVELSLSVEDDPYTGEGGRISTSSGSDVSSSDTDSTKTTRTDSEKSSTGHKGGLGMSGPNVEASEGNETGTSVATEDGKSHTGGTVDRNNKSVELPNHESKPREVWGQVTVGGASVAVDLGSVVVARPK